MRFANIKNIILILILFLLSFLSEIEALTPVINDGIMDFKEIQNGDDWKVSLNGRWEFYWNELLSPEYFKENESLDKKYIKVPSIWTNEKYGDIKIPRFGYATYRLKVVSLKKDDILALDLNRIFTNYRLWINGKLFVENGAVGKIKKEAKPLFSRRIINFINDKDEIEIVLQVSNFHDFRGGGIFRKIVLGSYSRIQKNAVMNFGFDLILIGALFFASLYHLLIFVLRKNEKILLAFSFFFLSYVVRVLLTNNNFVFFINNNLPWELLFKIEILTVFISAPILLILIYNLFSEEVNRKNIKVFYIVSLVYFAALVFTPSPYFVLVMILYYPFVFVIFIYSIQWLFSAIKNKLEDAVLFTFTFICFYLTAINDILFSLSKSNIPQLMPLGLVLFATIQALIIAKRFSASFYKKDELSVELIKSQKRLEHVNIMLEEKVKERTIELENQIKERERMETEIIKNQKLDAIGLLAGGIAHDFNNFLSIIMGNISLIKIIKNNQEQFDLSVKDAESACKSAGLLTNQLLTFSRGGEPIKQTMDISKLIKEVTDFTLSGTSILPEYRLDKELWLADIDKGQITQVITNILINAKQAMNEYGRLVITAENFVNEQFLKFVKIQIKDNGIGIPQSVINKVFDPFFTTKNSGKGLGLTTSFSIVKKHNGYIYVESDEGKGSVFTILFPANESNKKQNEKEEFKSVQRNLSGIVLILDDEDYILQLVKKMFSLSGIDVVTSTNGIEAVELYKEYYNNNKKFLFVILDLTVPGSMSGLQVLDEILKINKDEICIVSSGYSNDPVMSNPKKYGFYDVLKKPYSIENVLELIDKIILTTEKKKS